MNRTVVANATHEIKNVGAEGSQHEGSKALVFLWEHDSKVALVEDDDRELPDRHRDGAG